MTHTKLLAMTVLLLAAASGVAASAQEKAAVQASGGRIDSNGDGFIDRAEAAAMPKLAERFDALDTDGDGRLSMQERPARKHVHGGHGRRMAMARASLERLDRNGDRRISRAEAAGNPRVLERFERMDIDRDGFVDRNDRLQRIRQRSEKWFTEADANGDGQLSRAEFEAARDDRLSTMRKGERTPRGR